MHEIVGAVFKAISKAEVGDNDIAVTVKEKILEFKVTVNDLLLVNIPDTRYELCKQLASVFLSEIPMC